MVIILLVLVGKSASGKDAIKNELVRLGLEPIITYTTRSPRSGEENHKSYHFVTKEFFEDNKKRFFEMTSYTTVNGEQIYGSMIEDYGDNKVIILNPDGIKKIHKSNINAVIFEITADDSVRIKRSVSRDKKCDMDDEINRRLLADNEDFKDIEKYVDFTIRNDGDIKLPIIAKVIFYMYQKEMKKKGVSN